MLTTFQNVTISVRANNPHTAYEKLCDALALLGGDFSTDTYFVTPDRGEDGKPSSTEDLFPKHA